jgi:hypothetical protein
MASGAKYERKLDITAAGYLDFINPFSRTSGWYDNAGGISQESIGDVVSNLGNRVFGVTLFPPLSEAQSRRLASDAYYSEKRAGASESRAKETYELVLDYSKNIVSDENPVLQNPFDWEAFVKIVSVVFVGGALVYFGRGVYSK